MKLSFLDTDILWKNFRPTYERNDNGSIHVDAAVGRGLSKADVFRIAQTHVNDLEKCLAGQMTSSVLKIEIAINADGTVKDAGILSGGMADANIRQCLTQTIGQWCFDKTARGKTVKVILTLKFQP